METEPNLAELNAHHDKELGFDRVVVVTNRDRGPNELILRLEERRRTGTVVTQTADCTVSSFFTMLYGMMYHEECSLLEWDVESSPGDDYK